VKTSSHRDLTALALVPIFITIGLGALAALTGNLWFVLLAAAPGGLLIAALVLSLRSRLDEVSLCMRGQTRVAAAETVTQNMHVHNRGRRTLPPLAVTHAIRGLDEVRVHVEPLAPGGRAVVDMTRVARSRGTADHCSVTVTAVGPLGLVATHRTIDYAQRLIVHPRSAAEDLDALRRGMAEEAVDAVPGRGLDLAGVREWRPGDEPRRVHWRSSARRGRLVVTERGSSPAGLLTLVVVGPSQAVDWEEVVAAAAATCRTAQLAGRPVRVLAWGPGAPSADAPTETIVGLLDWWAALGRVDLPVPAAAVRSASGLLTGDLLVAASQATPPAWWADLRASAAAAGVVPVPLAVTR